jgi:aspartate kinase
MSLIVQKYGGTSVGSLNHIQNVAAHVASGVRSGNHLIVTISAMGEQTDDLLAMARQLHRKPPRRELDMLMTAGERISASLLAIALDNLGIRSVSLTGSQCGILTDETHGNARIKKILGDRIRQGIADNKVVIVAGFQGVSPVTREITTLGRGGTDLSAVAIAAAVGATKCQLYKDVDGVFTTDPRTCSGARLIRRLSWNSMTALAWNGANVLHPRSAHMAAKFNIPFEIRSSINLDREGTLITGDVNLESPVFEAMSQKKNMLLLEFSVPGAQAHAAYAYAVDWLWQHGDAPQFAQVRLGASGQSLSLAVKSDLAADLTAALTENFNQVRLERQLEKLSTIAMVGHGFQQSPESVAEVARHLPEATVAFESSNTLIGICLPEADLEKTVRSLHARFFEAPSPQ